MQKYYNKALAYAKSTENLGVCYANRSAVYYQLSLFSLCLENIELAKGHKLSNCLKSKLDDRQQAATTHTRTSKLVPKPFPMYDMRLCRPPMERQPFFINCLTKKVSGEIVTNEPLVTGDVISLEKPYSQLLSQSHIYERCTYCLTNKKYLSMIPCMLCSSAMFCNPFCYTMAQKIFHSFECSMIDGLYHFLPDTMYLGLRTVFVSMNECNGSLNGYRNMLRRCFNDKTNSFYINTISSDRSFNEMVFSIIHNLSRSSTFLMQHHLATAVLMKKLKAISVFNRDPKFDTVLSTAIFHMIRVSIEKSIVLEETAFNGDIDSVGNDLTIYGCGLFPFASNFTLSCAPNVLFINTNGVISGIALHPIRSDEVIQPGIM